MPIHDLTISFQSLEFPLLFSPTCSRCSIPLVACHGISAYSKGRCRRKEAWSGTISHRYDDGFPQLSCLSLKTNLSVHGSQVRKRNEGREIDCEAVQTREQGRRGHVHGK